MSTSLRFNLICHGLLGLIKPKGRCGWDIYVPYPQDPDECGDMAHHAMWGIPSIDNPDDKLKGLYDIPKENFLIDMHYQAPLGSECKFDENEFLILNGVVPQPDCIWSKISIPPPTVIRKYRAIESTPNPKPDPGTASVLVAQPRLVHEVIVFSYLDVRGPIVVVGDREQETRSRTLGLSEAGGTVGVDFSIYYQPLKEKKMGGKHSTAPFDRMFNVMYNGQLAPIHIDSLTSEAPASSTHADGPPGYFAENTGLEPKDLASLSELNGWESVTIETFQKRFGGTEKTRPFLLKKMGDIVIYANGDPTSCGPSSGVEGGG